MLSHIITTAWVATNGKSHTELHDVVLWGQVANFATKYLGKCGLVCVGGRLQSRQCQVAGSPKVDPQRV